MPPWDDPAMPTRERILCEAVTDQVMRPRICGGLLLPSQYGGFIHAFESDDDHIPVAPKKAQNPIGPPKLPWWRRLLQRLERHRQVPS